MQRLQITLLIKDKSSDKIRSSKICDLPGTSFLYLFSFIGKLPVFAMI